MISKEEKYKFINKLKSHTESVVKKIEKQFLPVFNAGKIFKVKQYHYLDRWIGYAASADEPSKTFSIIFVEDMPYKQIRDTKASSFTSSMEKMVHDNEIFPFMLFINNRFIQWDRIEIIHDYSRTYLKVYGEQYLYDYITNIKMLILPYNVVYVGEELESSFNANFKALSEYININAKLIDGIPYAILPKINDDYTIGRSTYNIGYWMYNQIRLKNLGLLSQERIDKLRKINIQVTDNINTSITTINIFDRDSYKQCDIDLLNNINTNNLLFSFDSTGLLDPDGKYKLYLLDKDEIFVRQKTTTYNAYTENISDVTFNNITKDNIIVFKNGMICTDYDIDVLYHNYKVYSLGSTIDYNLDGTTFTKSSGNNSNIFLFYNKDVIMNSLRQSFPNQSHISDASYNYFINNSNNGYIDKISEVLDFSIEDSKVYEDNFSEALDTVVNYNPLLFNELNHSSVYMKCMTGSEVNESLSKADKYGSIGLRIPRMRFDKDHETYAIVFVNGEIIDNYCDMIALSNYFFIPRDTKFKDTDTIEVLYFLNINNNEFNVKYNGKVFSNVTVVNSSNIVLNVFEDDYINNDEYNQYTLNVDGNNVSLDKYDGSKNPASKLYTLKANADNLDIVTASSDEFGNYIDYDEAKLFAINLDKSLLKYPEVNYNYEDMAFRVSENAGKNIKLIDSSLKGSTVTVVSSRKFIYQRFFIDHRAYRLRLDKRFRYCDNQKQYTLFINGRRVKEDAFLITIPKVSRPFDNMYLYTSQFVTKNDRIELFYLPEEFCNINTDYSIKININGYIECDKTILNFPFSRDFFMFFINGKKIPKEDIIDISTNMVRLKNDTRTTNELTIIPICRDYVSEVSTILQDHSKLSSFEALINTIKNSNSLGYSELNKLFEIYINISNIESPFKQDVAKIAIINEIIRDFWVTSGYDYNKTTFVYDYEMDDYIVKDNENDDYYILPALDARQEINIIKDDLHALFFQFMDNMPEYFEYGYVINNPLLSWEYADAYGVQDIEWQKINNTTIDSIKRQYQINGSIRKDTKYVLSASNGFNSCESTVDIRFCNGIYYGTVDEDLLDNRVSDLYHIRPDVMLKDAGVTKVVQPSCELTLTNYIINNNTYFVYAAPKRLVYDENGKCRLSFFVPRIEDIDFSYRNDEDPSTVPVLTDGTFEVFDTSKYDQYLLDINSKDATFAKVKSTDKLSSKIGTIEARNRDLNVTYNPDPSRVTDIKIDQANNGIVINSNGPFDVPTVGVLNRLDTFKIDKELEFEYTNMYGYTETYVVFKSNGFFTRLYDNTKFNIIVKQY